VFAAFSFEVDVSHQFLFARKDDFCFIGEVNLHYFVAETEHDCVFRFHPFFDVAISTFCRGVLGEFCLAVSVEIVAEVLQKCHFFL